ncbi:Hcp family type VI secretion system effector [Rhodoferax fermentans]|uniref:Type VI secretion protein n=1 Tax=Rhodoferax fermentans TaxID=28066 RepID=A0A1T1APS7_RHOFE|nr:type VI secretion system tube protein Hcp [Rhodoferax fermentans]MBK1682657.1 Hcp1 family type VI secretion system effector [Rhodoferax fermentans]OOV06037.1 type VI secretion protein [Rhodoferax fermentans]
MAIDCFIKFDGVEGESSNKDHKGAVDVLSWSWGIATAGQVGGTSTGKGKTVAEPLSFVHLYDKASPLLAKHCAAGKLFKTVVLTSRKAGEGQKDFLQVSLKEVHVTSVQPSCADGGEIIEAVTLTYRDIEFAYKPQDGKGGLGGDVKFGWDVASAQVR